MPGNMQTRIVPYVTLLLLMAWEGYVLLRYGKGATISVTLGELFAADPAVLLVLAVFVMHCVYAARTP